MASTDHAAHSQNSSTSHINHGQPPHQQSKKRETTPTSIATPEPLTGPVLRLRGGGADAKRKEARKRKFGQHQSQVSSSRSPEQSGARASKDTEPHESEQPSRKRKRKQEKDVSKKNSDDSNGIPTALETPDSEAPLAAEAADTEPTDPADAAAPPSKPQRFIVFIGNLPFSTTTASIRTHFSSVQPLSIRHSTHKQSGKSKGFAFLEFSGYDRMKTCLKLFHHSSFEDGVSPARKINVELTAGGGGAKSKDRREKLATKNEKLNEERKRRAMEEEKASKKGGKGENGEEGADAAATPDADAGDVHPSRKARVPQG